MLTKFKIIFSFAILLCLGAVPSQAQQAFHDAYNKIDSMLAGHAPLDFECAVFLTENAYHDNAYHYADFNAAIDIQTAIIQQLIAANTPNDWQQYRKTAMGVVLETEQEAEARYKKALANWAIYTYITDTLHVNLASHQFKHLPFTYSNEDPFGTSNWNNTQVLNLLQTQRGNCNALVSLFKIFSERLGTDANMVTAPQHIYIEHQDPKGDLYNVELATRSFPASGAIQTLTYTTREALLNNAAMHELTLKQSVALCLVYLAKGYEHKYGNTNTNFQLQCAEKVLQHDAQNLNALLLKAQVYEHLVRQDQLPDSTYINLLTTLHHTGYRQMPDDMQQLILADTQGTTAAVTPTNKTPDVYASMHEPSRYVTLSNGLFEEVHTPEKIVRYGNTFFDVEENKIVEILEADTFSTYQIDPVVFALSVDPLTKEYPELTPYQFASNTPIQAIDLDGLESSPVNGVNAEEYGEVFRREGKELNEKGKSPADPAHAKALENATGLPEGTIESNYDLLLGYITLNGQRSGSGRVYKSGGPLPLPKAKPKLILSKAPIVKISEARQLLSKALNRQNLKSAPNRFKEKWSEGGYDYEVRIHEPQANAPANSNSATKTTLRVARRQQGVDENDQGYGWEYADDTGNWYKASDLKAGKDQKAANDTHIPLN